MQEEQQPKIKKYSVLTIIITTLAVIIILYLAFLLYYYSTMPAPAVLQGSAPIVKMPVQKIIPTNVIIFAPPDPLPTVQKIGECFASSIAAPYRKDAFRCELGNSIYDPCFSVDKKGFVYCQVGIDGSTGFLMKLTQALPKPEVPPTIQDNWVWFLTLKDGMQCSPFTGTRPFFGNPPNIQIAYYGCKSADPNEEIYLLGDLTKGNVWTASEAIVTKIGATRTIKSTQQVDIDTVWQ